MNRFHLARGDDAAPPHSLEAEMAVLGALLFDSDRSIYEEVSRELRVEHFYAHVHGTIYLRICELVEDGSPVDKITLCELLRANNEYEKIGEVSYISKLMDTIQTLSSAKYFADLIVEKARLRALMDAGIALYRSALNGETWGPTEVAGQSVSRIERIVESHSGSNTIDASDAARNLMSLIDAGGLQYQHSPWNGLNARIGGFMPGELIIIGSTPGQGKSGVVNSLAHYFAYLKIPVMQLCLEMDVRPTLARYAAMLTNISSHRIITGQVTDDERNLISDKLSDLFAAYPIRLGGKLPGWGVADIRIAARKYKRERGSLGAIFVDHVGFLRDVIEAVDSQSKHERLDAAFKGLLSIAAELECPVFAVQHMNRSVKDGLPTMFDLRDGGNPEGNAHTIIIPWRTNPNHDDLDERTKGLFIVEKAREGETGKCKMRFWMWRGMWVDEDYQYPWWEQRHILDDLPPTLEPPPPPLTLLD